MRTMKTLALAAFAASALALAGCGGGGSNTSSLTGTGGGGGGGGGGGNGGTTPATPTSLTVALNEATDTLTTLSGATGSVKTATDAAAKITTLGSGGDSSVAMTSAQAVLNARTTLATAIETAEEAKTAAEEAKAKLDATKDADAMALLNTAIAAAGTQITAARVVLNGDALRALVVGVTECPPATGVCTGDMKPKTAADKAKDVADDIYSALTRANNPPAVVGIPSPHNTSDTVGALVKGPSDAQGMTFAEIFGSKVMDKRIASAGSTVAVKATSIDDDAKVSDFLASASGTKAAFSADGAQTEATYKGIKGVLFCSGDCKAEGAGTDLALADKLTGSWYFTNRGRTDEGSNDNETTMADSTYTAGTGANAGTYTFESPGTYVRYGYWLSEGTGGNAGVFTINRYQSGPPATSADEAYGIDPNTDALSGNSATYKGKALGMSVVWETDTKGKEVKGSRASGGFTANVDLKMTFGISDSAVDATLKGTISNFEGNGVDTSWSVDLDSANLSDGIITGGGTGVTDGGDDAGTWTATAWGGSATTRPKGVYGAFDADFTNGAAGGVYSTRKQ